MTNIFSKGVKIEPVFKSPREYEKFRHEFYESVRQELEENEKRRARSWAVVAGINPDALKF